jgi:hypothetical protein
MRWVRRALWVAGWSAWAWCGWRLSCELPVKMEQPVFSLALEADEHPLGFTDGGRLVVTTQDPANGRRRFGIWDARTGEKRHDLVGPLVRCNDAISLRQGLVVGFVPVADSDATAVEVLDLASGLRRELEGDSERVLTIHEARPWVALSDAGPLGKTTKVSVFDIQTGRLLLTCSGKPDARWLFHCQFTEGDEILLFSGDPLNDPLADVSLEVGRFSVGRGELERRQVVLKRSIAPPVRGGRAVGKLVTSRTGQVEVAEVMTGRIVFRSADHLQRASGNEDWSMPVKLSVTGRRLLNTAGSLWSLDEGRTVWTESPIDQYVDQEPTPETFLVWEDWQPVLKWFRLSLEATSMAVRDMESGTVRRRFQGTSAYWPGMLTTVSADGHRLVDPKGNVYEPSNANWPLLAICQTILALPLILLWLALLWRRKRRERRLVGAVA